jgi:tetratricopeptide (TPR) repeat protein
MPKIKTSSSTRSARHNRRYVSKIDDGKPAVAIYDAFISYSHAKDKPIAGALQSVIQRLGKPWYRRRALRVFRDDTSLSATPHLWPTIEQALGQSRFFILLASEEAAASKWVNKEVGHWLEHNSMDTLLIGVTGGQLAWDETTGDFARGEQFPLPDALAGRFTSEPKWVDLREYRAGANSRNARFIELGADFAAAVRGMPKEDLLSQEVRQQRRALSLAWSAAGSLFVLAGLAVWQWREAVVQKDRAELNLAQATETANGIVSEIAMRFKDVGLPADLVRDIIDRARALQEVLIDAGQATPALRRSEGRALLESVRALITVGDTVGALSAAERARRIFEELAAGGEDRYGELQRNVALSYGYIGDVLTAQGDRDEALNSQRAAFAIFERLLATEEKLPIEEFDPSRRNVRRNDVAVSHARIGDLLQEQGNLEEALASFQASHVIRQRLAEYDQDSVWQHGLAVSYNKLGGILGELALMRFRAGDQEGMRSKLDEALKNYQDSLALMQKVVAADPKNTALQRELSVAYGKVGDVLGGQGKREESIKYFQSSIATIEQLAASDRGNAGWQHDLAMSYSHLGDLLKAEGKLDDALANYHQELSILARLASSNRGNAEWQRNLSSTCFKVGDMLLERDKPADALRSLQDCVSAQRLTASDADPGSVDTISGRLGTAAYRLVLAKNFAQAIEAADLSISLAPGKTWLYTNRAHALMLLGRIEEARALYLQYSGRPKVEGEKTWETLVVEDFAQLRNAGIRNRLMDEIETKFSARG